MNLEEFRKALSSDATEENARLKKQLSDLQTDYHEKVSKLESENDLLKEICGLDYPCPHMPGLEERVTMAHELRKGIEKNG